MGENIINVTDSNFETKVLNSDKPVLVDFWAAWCGPCKMIAPVVEDIAEDYDGKLVVGKMNVDENKNTPTKLGIMSIPTLILFQDGQEQERIIGFRTKDELKEIIDKNL